MVRCPRCGYENDVTDIYCRNCTYPLQDPNTNYRTKRKRDSSWNIGTGKKIILVIGIIVIALLLFTIVHNMTQPSSESSLNVISDDDTTVKEENFPYQVNITTNGSWSGKAGDPNHISQVSGSGSKIFKLQCPAWDKVNVTIQKDYSSLPLTVQLLRNGQVIAENTTSAPGGVIALSN